MPSPTVAYLSYPGTILTSASSIDVPLIGEIPGDIVIVHVHALAKGTTVNTSSLVNPGWIAVEDSFDAANQRLVIYRQIADPIDKVTIINYSAESRRYFFGSVVIRGSGGVTDTALAGALPSAGGTGVAMDVTAADSLVLQMMWGLQDAPGGTINLHPPGGWTSPVSPLLSTPDSVTTRRLASRVSSVDTDPFAFTIDSSLHGEATGWYLYSFVFDPAPPAPPPSTATTGSPRRLSLTCASSYGVWLTDSTYAQTIDKLGFSALSFERVLDNISVASVSLPDSLGGLRCLTQIPSIDCWEYGILIERNDQQVWRGPITNISRSTAEGSLRLTASDALVRHSLNLAIWDGDKEYQDVDSGAVFTDIINVRARNAADTYRIEAPEFFTGQSFSRKLVAKRLELAWTVLQELLDSTVDAFVMNGLLYCWSPTEGWVYGSGGRTIQLDGPYNAQMDLQYGMFTNESFSDQPDWAMSGMQRANFVEAPTADSGDLGFRTIYTAQDAASIARVGVLVAVEPNTLHRPDDEPPAQADTAFQRRADTILALRANTPAIMSGGTLNVGAPIDFDNLWPGSLWDIDYQDHGYGQLLTTGRLQRVQVSVAFENGVVTEKIVPTLYPPGYTGS